ncbi:MAG: hypothetical protein HOV80_30030 [Polyangiaceae bacterium]|nr:hypothetical protein [Polyangiaceae bacterium]
MAASLLVGAMGGCTGVATVTDPLRHAGSPQASALPSGVTLEEPVALETHEGLAWVLTKNGALVSLSRENERMVRHLAQDPVLGLHRTPDAKLWALTRDAETDDLRLWEHDAMTWSVAAEWMGMGAEPFALTSSGGRPVVISPAAAFVLEGNDLRGVELTDKVGTAAVTALAAATKNGTAYVYDRVAEDAGYLNAIDLETGDVSSIVCPASSSFSLVGPKGERRQCAGITGIVADPSAADCVLVSFIQGPQHGFLWRVCDDHSQIVKGPWEELGFDDAPARALAPFRERSSQGERAAEPPPGSRGGFEELCAIDPSACKAIDLPEGPLPLLGLAPADEAVWVATPDALIAWRPGAAPRFVLRSFGWVPSGPREERSNLVTLKGKTRTLLAAEATTMLPDAQGKPPAAACYHANNGEKLCLKEGRYRLKSEVDDDNGSVLIRPLGDGSYAVDVEGGERLTMLFAEDRALLLRKEGDHRVGARLARLSAEETRALLEADE